MAITLECAHCEAQKELSDNMSVKRLVSEADQFFKEHGTKIQGISCKAESTFIRTSY